MHLCDDNSGDSVTTGIIKALRQLPEHMRLTLTWHRGMEMAGHANIFTALHMPIFFLDPASFWQRGTNENSNGLLRQYLPKGTRLSIHNSADLRCIRKAINNRPQESLDVRTPTEVFTETSVTSNPLRCNDSYMSCVATGLLCDDRRHQVSNYPFATRLKLRSQITDFETVWPII